jgi:hypothetical protein
MNEVNSQRKDFIHFHRFTTRNFKMMSARHESQRENNHSQSNKNLLEAKAKLELSQAKEETIKLKKEMINYQSETHTMRLEIEKIKQATQEQKNEALTATHPHQKWVDIGFMMDDLSTNVKNILM